MIKSKIKWIQNTNESIWFSLTGSYETIKELHKIFEIDDSVVGKMESYSDINGYNQYLNEKNYTVYILYLEKEIHVILRKIKKWEQKRDKIIKHFDFLKPEV